MAARMEGRYQMIPSGEKKTQQIGNKEKEWSQANQSLSKGNEYHNT